MSAAASTGQIDFSHLDHGVPESRWAALGLHAVPAVSAPGAGATVLVVAAHPDDETLGAGGLIHAAAAAGATVRIVIASAGAASHPRSPTHTPERLARVRRAEAEHAAAALGAPSVAVLDLPDGALGDHVPTLAAVLSATCPNPDLIVAPWVEDGHPDHAAASRAAELVAQASGAPLWQYPIWLWHWLDPADAAAMDADSPEGPLPVRRLRQLPVGPAAAAAKETAIAAYASQHLPLSPAPGDEAVLAESMLAHFRRSFETFVVPAPAERAEYFDALYRASADPWGLGERWYELRKRELLLATLPRPRATRVFEPGCALGHLTVRLAERADEVIAWDASPEAVRAAQSAMRSAGWGGSVSVRQGRIPSDWPSGAFDLIVLSEVGYYCADLALLVDRIAASLTADGAVVACHWRHPAPDHPLTAEAVHSALSMRLTRIAGYADGDVLLDVFSMDDRSVAERDGLVPARPAHGS